MRGGARNEAAELQKKNNAFSCFASAPLLTNVDKDKNSLASNPKIDKGNDL